ncbi:MAG: hydrogenase maturation protease [bacterium]
MPLTRTLILGVGNLLLGDEGIGIHVARQLQSMPLPPTVEVLDGGTGGFELLDFCRNRDKIIIVDAMMADEEPGSIIRATPEELELRWHSPRSAHFGGLRELLDALKLETPVPEIIILGIVPAIIDQLTMELSPKLKTMLDQISLLVIREVGN